MLIWVEPFQKRNVMEDRLKSKDSSFFCINKRAIRVALWVMVETKITARLICFFISSLNIKSNSLNFINPFPSFRNLFPQSCNCPLNRHSVARSTPFPEIQKHAAACVCLHAYV